MRFSDAITRCAGLLAGLLVAVPAVVAQEPEALTVVTWGGAYEAAQKTAVFVPFTEATGIPVEVKRYSGAIGSLRKRAEAESWDVIDMLEADAITGCEDGLLRKLRHDEILGGLDRAVRRDFAPTRLRPCSLPQNVFATVMAYDDRAYPGLKPTRIEDFFDVEEFPGKRAIHRSPDVILEWALMAEGVPAAQVYDLLSTDRGLRLALRRLEALRGHIVWWEDAGAPARLLEKGEVAMASGYNGRFFAAAQDRGAPVSVIWDGRLIGTDVWAMPVTTDRPEAARAFLEFAARPEVMAGLAARIPYGPARKSAMEWIGLHPESGVPMRDHLPNAPQHGARMLVRDSVWYSHTEAIRERRFEAWLEKGGG